MPETIITSDAPSTSFQLNPTSRIICHVCQKQFSQYTCPRCNSRYCSLHCYKSHSIRCTESFMRENVMEELQQLQPDDQTKQKMLDILKRFHLEEEMDSVEMDDSSLSEKTVEKILSGVEISFDDLSAEEKKHFQRAVASGELSKLIEPWDPWWLKPSAKNISLSQEGTRLVQPLVKHEAAASFEDNIETDELYGIPLGPKIPLPPVSKLSSTKPSPLLAVHLVDIIYSHCFTLRLYNGDWQSDAIGSAMVIMSISTVLGQGAMPESVTEALSHCLEQTCSPAFRHMGGLQFGVMLIDDAINLLSLGSAALVCLLYDLQQLIQASQSDLRSEKPQKSTSLEIKSKLKAAERKVYFIMCWVHEQPAEAWCSLVTILGAEKSVIIECGTNRKASQIQDYAAMRSRNLIEEVQ